ncbi:hypothetical protein ABI59_05150 [Acidobacteria bacterium Mor1]|nr:hypothetical protein ABI59_05150 [Acidobacteria bacterium Mor1]
MTSPTVLVVEDEKLLRWSLREALSDEGYAVLEAADGREARQHLGEDGVDLVLLDMRLPDADGLSILKDIKERDPDIVVILMTAYSSIETAVQAIKAGAFDYADKPFDMDRMMVLVGKALETTRLRREVRALRARESEPYAFDAIIGESPAMVSIKRLLRKVAASPATTVLLTGESGTGKDLAAKVIHYNSDRAGGPFMNVTCSALTETLLESELFGHEQGAFTDAKKRKQGLFELAHQGTVYLDEVGEIPQSLQVKLLRFLEERSFRRVGGTRDLTVDVRIVAATNRNLDRAVQAGEFREDLYYRLSVMPVRMPPMRERGEDVLLLARHYVDRFNREFRRDVQQIDPEAAERLTAQRWPGNVRELKNAVERAMLLAEGQTLSADDFQILAPSMDTDFRLPPAGIDFEQLEKQLVIQALQRSGGNQTKAAKLLGMNRDQIRYRIEKFGLTD